MPRQSPLSGFCYQSFNCMHNFKFCCFLKAISNNIYIAYDNDTAGQTAAKNIIKEIQIDPEFEKAFKFLNFQGKDLNDSYKTKGKDYLYSMLQTQLF